MIMTQTVPPNGRANPNGSVLKSSAPRERLREIRQGRSSSGCITAGTGPPRCITNCLSSAGRMASGISTTGNRSVFHPSGVPHPRSGATIPVPVAAAENTKNAAVPVPDVEGSIAPGQVATHGQRSGLTGHWYAVSSRVADLSLHTGRMLSTPEGRRITAIAGNRQAHVSIRQISKTVEVDQCLRRDLYQPS